MNTYIVNVEQKRITPVVVEAANEWEAMNKVSNGEGYIHETGSIDISLDPLTWNVENYRETNTYSDLDFTADLT